MKKYLNSVEEVVKALKEGKEVFASEPITDRAYKFYFKDGFLMGEEKNCADIHINTHLIFIQSSKYYTEEPEPLKFEVNRAYKVECGKKVFIESDFKEDKRYRVFFENGFYFIDYNGKNCNGNTKWDIYGYWEEEK